MIAISILVLPARSIPMAIQRINLTTVTMLSMFYRAASEPSSRALSRHFDAAEGCRVLQRKRHSLVQKTLQVNYEMITVDSSDVSDTCISRFAITKELFSWCAYQ